MRNLWKTLIGIFALGAPLLLLAGSAHAASSSIVQELKVTARVLPMRHIIVDPTGQIVQITSNTASDITPEVFVLNDLPANRQPLTGQIYKAYRQHVPVRTAHAGVLYTRSTIVSSLSPALANLPS